MNHGLASIAFPCISTGVYRYPVRPAAEIAIATCRAFAARFPLPERILCCCCFSAADLACYQSLLAAD